MIRRLGLGLIRLLGGGNGCDLVITGEDGNVLFFESFINSLFDVLEDAIKGGGAKFIGRLLATIGFISGTADICNACSGPQALVTLETYCFWTVMAFIFSAAAAVIVSGVAGILIGLALGLIFAILITGLVNLMTCLCYREENA